MGAAVSVPLCDAANSAKWSGPLPVRLGVPVHCCFHRSQTDVQESRRHQHHLCLPQPQSKIILVVAMTTLLRHHSAYPLRYLQFNVPWHQKRNLRVSNGEVWEHMFSTCGGNVTKCLNTWYPSYFRPGLPLSPRKTKMPEHKDILPNPGPDRAEDPVRAWVSERFQRCYRHFERLEHPAGPSGSWSTHSPPGTITPKITRTNRGPDRAEDPAGA